MFIGSGYDFRASDASLLGAKIESCINNGFDVNLIGNIGNSPDKIGLLSEKCGIDKTLLETYYKIKICERKLAKTSSDCIVSSKSVLVFGDVEPCEATEATKFLGCSRRVTNDYIIITATNRKLERISR
jgi:hypothetical protein